MKKECFIITSILDLQPEYRVHVSYCDNLVRLYSTVDKIVGYKQDIKSSGFDIFVGEALGKKTGVYITYDLLRNTIQVGMDYYGTEEIFYYFSEGRFAISNRLDCLVEFLSKNRVKLSVNNSAIHGFMSFSYFIGDSTLFNEIQQLEEKNRLCLSYKDKEFFESKSLEEFYFEKESIPNIDNPVNIMMSAGWDSRVILSMLENKKDSLAVTHGDLSSREINITRKLTGMERLDHIFLDSKHCTIDYTTIEDMLNELGYCYFILWYYNTKKISKININPIVSGVLGEHFGGHYGLVGSLKGWNKLLGYMSFIFPSIKKNIMKLAVAQLSKPSKDLWFFKESYSKELILNDIGIVSDVKKKLEEYGGCDNEVAIERFNMSHRARKYILKQAHASKTSTGYINPFTMDYFVSSSNEESIEKRDHNKLSKKFVKMNNSALLKLPMASTLVPAYFSRNLQEFSRLIRVVISKLSRKGRVYGWFNMDFLKDGALLRDISKSLNSEIWDKDRIDSNIQNFIDSGDKLNLAYSLDTLCKAKYIDHVLSSWEENQ